MIFCQKRNNNDYIIIIIVYLGITILMDKQATIMKHYKERHSTCITHLFLC